MKLEELLNVIHRRESARYHIALLDDDSNEFKPYTYRRIRQEELYKREVYEIWNPSPSKYFYNTYWIMLKGKENVNKKH